MNPSSFHRACAGLHAVAAVAFWLASGGEIVTGVSWWAFCACLSLAHSWRALALYGKGVGLAMRPTVFETLEGALASRRMCYPDVDGSRVRVVPIETGGKK